jgi:hypothetical protein
MLQIRGNSSCKTRGNWAVKIKFAIIFPAKFVEKVPNTLVVMFSEKVAANSQLRLQKIGSFLCGNISSKACVNQHGKLIDFLCGKLSGSCCRNTFVNSPGNRVDMVAAKLHLVVMANARISLWQKVRKKLRKNLRIMSQ